MVLTHRNSAAVCRYCQYREDHSLFTRKGIGMDDEVTLRQQLNAIPKDCFQRNYIKAFAYLIADLSLLSLTVSAIIFFDNWIAGVPLSIFLGTLLSGLFVLGHDAGHRSFGRSLPVNNIVGNLTMALSMWPFHIWRLSHNRHHAHTHHVHLDVAWKPASVQVYQRMNWKNRLLYRHARTTFFFVGSAIFTFLTVMSYVRNRELSPRDRRGVIRSLWITVVTAIAMIAGSILVGGVYGFVTLFVIPQTIFHVWLSIFTLLHHTTPDVRFMDPGSWTREKAGLECSVHIRYPRIVDVLNHDISWHVPHHVSSAIPHYNLRRAYRSLRVQFADRIVERRFSFTYLLEVLRSCQLIEDFKPGGQNWVTFEEVRTSNGKQELKSTKA